MEATATPKREFGVFLWEGSNMYLGRNAVKRYGGRNAAERYADKLNETTTDARGYVVREITRE